jgi:hypothetical protein
VQNTQQLFLSRIGSRPCCYDTAAVLGESFLLPLFTSRKPRSLLTNKSPSRHPDQKSTKSRMHRKGRNLFLNVGRLPSSYDSAAVLGESFLLPLFTSRTPSSLLTEKSPTRHIGQKSTKSRMHRKGIFAQKGEKKNPLSVQSPKCTERGEIKIPFLCRVPSAQKGEKWLG